MWIKGANRCNRPSSVFLIFFSKGTAATRVQESREVKTVSQIQNELKRQFSDVKEIRGPAELRRLSLDSARPNVSSAQSGSKVPQDSYGSDFEKELTNEQVASWRDAVEKWVSRPHPLGGGADTERTPAGSSVNKPSKVPSSVTNVPKLRNPAAVNSLDASFQDVHTRPSSSMEEKKALPAKHVDGIASGQLKSDSKTARQDSRPPVAPLVIRKEEHREDPRLRRPSVDAEPSPELKSPEPLAVGYGMPYNAQEALQAQGITITSVQTSTTLTSSSVSVPYKYQVDGKSLRSILESMLQFQKRGDSGYQVNLDEGTRRALEMLKQQSNRRNSDPHDDDARRGSGSLRQQEEPTRRNSDLQDDRPRSSLEILKQQQPLKKGSFDVQDHNVVTMDKDAIGKSAATVLTNDERSVKKKYVSAMEDKSMKRVTGASVQATQEQGKESCESRKGKRPVQAGAPDNKRAKFTKLKEVEKQDALSESLEKPVVPSVVPELSEDPFPAISSKSLETLKSRPSRSDQPKVPKLKLILSKNKSSKETSVQLSADSSDSAEQKHAEQPVETNSEQADKLNSNADNNRVDRKSIESPVAMDISPVHTMPDASRTVSPITVVSSKGRYNQAVSLSVAPTTVVHSSPVYPSPGSSNFPFSPPLPQGPYRSPISAVMPPIQFSVSSTSASTIPDFTLAGVQSILPVPSSGTVPFIPPIQAGAAFPPTCGMPSSHVPPMPPIGSPSTPMPPPHVPTDSIQRKNSADSVANAVASSPGLYPPTFPDQQWTSPLPSNQGFGFHQPFPALPRPGLPPAVARPPVVPALGVPPQPPLPRPPSEGSVVQSQGLGFVPIAAPRFPVPPVTSQGTAFVLPQGPHPLPPMGPVLPPSGVMGAPQVTPRPPMLGAPPQFIPRPPFQQPSLQRPVGFWAAPFLPNYGGPPIHPSHQSSGKRHSKESTVTKPSPSHKSSHPKNVTGDGKPQKNDAKKNSEKSGDGAAKSDASVPELNKDKPNAQTEKSKEAVVRKPDMSEDKDSASSTEKKTLESSETAAVEELRAGSAKEETEAKDLDKSKVNETCIQTPEKQTEAAVCRTEEQNVGTKDEMAHDKDSTTHDTYPEVEYGVVSKEIASDVEQPCNVTLSESEICDVQNSAELSDDLPNNKGDTDNFGIARNSGEVVDIDTSLTSLTDYVTEAEQTSTKAKSKIYDILRRSAYESRSETESAEHGQEELDEPDRPDDQDFKPDAVMEEGGIFCL